MFYLCESEATATTNVFCSESEAAATNVFCSESEVTATNVLSARKRSVSGKAPSRNGNRSHVLEMSLFFSTLQFMMTYNI